MTETPADMNEFVRRAYDEVAVAHLEERHGNRHDLPYLDRLITGLQPGDRVLDVGCGAGLPIAAHLVFAGLDVTGIDISPVQVEMARRNVPEATFLARDMSDLEEGEFSVAAVVAFYSLFHTPRETHLHLLTTLRSFLRDGGRLLCTLGSTEWEGEEPFFGTPMRWSHFGAETSRRLVTEAGFVIDVAEIAEHRFGDELECHLVVSAVAGERPGSGTH